MKTKELIRRLQEADPGGELECCVGNVDIYYIDILPSYYDGCLQILEYDEKLRDKCFSIVGARREESGSKIMLVPYSIREAISDDPDFPVSYTEYSTKHYKKHDDIYREEMKIENEQFKQNLERNDQMSTQITDKNVHQSRWGYHFCSYETLLKLKKLRKHYFESLRKAAAWYRWARKAEHNRKGKEPQINSVFCELISTDKQPRQWNCYNGKWATVDGNRVYYIPDGNNDKTLLVRDHGILEAYEQARMPQSSKEEVKSLDLSEAQIDILLNEFED